MGALIAKFRKEKSSYDILEQLEVDIKSIEEYGYSTERQRRQIITNLIIISVGLYVSGTALIYQYFLPQSWPERMMYFAPVLVFPVVMFVIKKFVAWFYDRKLSKNSSKLKQLRKTREQILEEVMEKKTYKEARKILERFGDKTSVKPSVITPAIRQSHTPGTTPNLKLMQIDSTPQIKGLDVVPLSSTNVLNSVRNRGGATASSVIRRPLPRPVLSVNRSVIDKVVDYLVGDGPSNRFALICTQCHNHNGMALVEEFEYLAFRCAFCSTFNPSRKQRPSAPSLPQSYSDIASSKTNSSESSDQDELADDIDDSNEPKSQTESDQNEEKEHEDDSKQNESKEKKLEEITNEEIDDKET